MSLNVDCNNQVLNAFLEIVAHDTSLRDSDPKHSWFANTYLFETLQKAGDDSVQRVVHRQMQSRGDDVARGGPTPSSLLDLGYVYLPCNIVIGGALGRHAAVRESIGRDVGALLLADLAFTTTSRAFVLDVHRRSIGFCCYWTFEGENSSTWTVRAAVVHQHAFELDAVC